MRRPVPGHIRLSRERLAQKPDMLAGGRIGGLYAVKPSLTYPAHLALSIASHGEHIFKPHGSKTYSDRCTRYGSNGADSAAKHFTSTCNNWVQTWPSNCRHSNFANSFGDRYTCIFHYSAYACSRVTDIRGDTHRTLAGSTHQPATLA